MLSKWLDGAVCLASFHYQCDQYSDIRPPSFGANPNVRNETRERERLRKQTLHETVKMIVKAESIRGGVFQRWRAPKKKSPQAVVSPPIGKSFQPNRKFQDEQTDYIVHPTGGLHSHDRPKESTSQKRSSYANAGKLLHGRRRWKHSALNTPTPSLFLQEAAHLFSLLSSVAMSTLRHDVEGTQSPLTEYIPGRPFPPVNPDDPDADIDERYFESNRFWTFINFCLGLERSRRHRTLYNAARPFRVLGGVSDKECELLMEANGPYAEMALCNMWLKEFVSREHLHGSTGRIAPPIMAKVFQFISDGVLA